MLLAEELHLRREQILIQISRLQHEPLGKQKIQLFCPRKLTDPFNSYTVK